jgi:hypothetical protein
LVVLEVPLTVVDAAEEAFLTEAVVVMTVLRELPQLFATMFQQL